MTTFHTFEIVDAHIERLSGLSEALLDILRRERSALIERRLDALEQITADKARRCAAVDEAIRAFGPEPLERYLAALSQPQRRRLDPAHQRLQTLAEETRHLNALNGRLLHRSRQSLETLKQLLGSTNGGTLYTARGRTASGSSASTLGSA